MLHWDCEKALHAPAAAWAAALLSLLPDALFANLSWSGEMTGRVMCAGKGFGGQRHGARGAASLSGRLERHPAARQSLIERYMTRAGMQCVSDLVHAACKHPCMWMHGKAPAVSGTKV